MSIISTALLDHQPDMKNFSCGVSSIDRMVGEAYLDHLVRKTMTFQIMFLGRAIGYYQLTIKNVYLDESRKTNLEYAEYGSGEMRYGFLSINFLAIQQEIQNMGIGTTMLRQILQDAEKLSKKWPIRVVHIEAFRDKVEWYEDNGFEKLYDDDNTVGLDLVPMFFELLPQEEKEKIEDYCNSYYE